MRRSSWKSNWVGAKGGDFLSLRMYVCIVFYDSTFGVETWREREEDIIYKCRYYEQIFGHIMIHK